MKYIALLLLLALNVYGQFEDPPTYQPYNLSFENAAVGSVPTQWMLNSNSEKKGFYAEATIDDPFHGKYCMSLELPKDTADGGELNAAVVQRLDATPYRGKKIKITAMVKADMYSEGYAGLYVSERTTDNQYPYISTSDDNPTTKKEWEYKEATLYVTDNAFSINYGLFLQGNGKAWIDYVSVEVVSTSQEFEVTTNLSSELKTDLLNFSKAYGEVKFFHSSDEVYNINEETYLYNSISKIKSAKSQVERNSVIKNRLMRLAPAAKIFENKKSAEKYKASKPIAALKKVAMTQITNNIYQKNGSLNFGTKRWNIYDSRMPREASAYQIINAKNLRGKNLNFNAKAKVEAFGKDAFAELWFRIDLEEEGSKPINYRYEKEITANEWKEYSMDVEIPDNAKQIRIGLVFFGEGKAWFDDTSVDEVVNHSTVSYRPKNFTFNNKWQPNQIEYWRIPNSVIEYGYSFEVDNSKDSYDGASLLISTDKKDFVELPDENDYCVIKVKDDIWLSLPLTVYVNKEHTLPKSDMVGEELITANPNDYIAKMSVFIETWNYLRYYSVVDFSDLEWDNLFLDYITEVAESNTIDEFESIMNKSLKVTNNVRAEFWKTKKSFDFLPPFIPEFNASGLTVFKSFTNSLLEGDKVLKINGIDVNSYLNGKSENLPGNNVNWKHKKVYYDFVLGEYETVVELKLERARDTIDVRIARNITLRELHLLRPLTLEWVTDDIMYIDGTRLNDFEFMELMKRFNTAKGIIIDFRGDALLSEHVLGFFHNEDFTTYQWGIQTFTNPCSKPIRDNIKGYVKTKQSELSQNVVFLSDGSSVGKSETILRLAKHYNIGTIVGESTVGSYDILTSVRLPAFYNLSISVYPISFDNDKNIKFKPITPDVLVSGNQDYPNDPKVNKAIELLENNIK